MSMSMSHRGVGDSTFDPEAFQPWVGEYAGGDCSIVVAMFADDDFGAPYPFYLEGDDVVRLEQLDAVRLLSARGEKFELVGGATQSGTSLIVRRADGGDGLRLARTASPVEQHVRFGRGLAGTVLLPAGSGPFSAVVAAHGAAGGQRDFYRLFAHTMVGAGVSVLIYDKPGFGESAGAGQPTIFSQAEAIEAGVDYLRERSDVRQVGLWGFSNGMWAVPLVAVRDSDIAFVAGIGSPGVSMAESEIHRRACALRRAGVSPAVIERVRSAWRAVFAAIAGGRVEGAASQALDQVLRDLADEGELSNVPIPAFARVNPALSPIPPPSLTVVRSFLDGTADPELGHDPVVDYQRIRCPIFLQYGEQDLNVPVTASVAAIRAAVERSGNPDLTIRTYANAQHMLDIVDPGNGTAGGNGAQEDPEEAEYLMRHFTFTRGARDDLRNWMSRR
jgi:uncharacterized protein